MENNIVKEVNVDNVIPLKQQKFITEPLILLNEYLIRINRYSVREIVDGEADGIYDLDNYQLIVPGVFDRFWISLKQQEIQCCFAYRNEFNTKGILFNWKITDKHENPKNQRMGDIQILKNDLRNDLGRKQTAIWIVLNIFSNDGFVSYPSNCRTKEDLNKFYFENIIGTEHSVRIL